MADNNDLTQEEKDKAAELEAEAGKEKTAIEKVGDELGELTSLLKSQVEKKPDPDDGEVEKDEPIDFDNLDPAELAKSFGEDKEKAKEFIAKLAEESGLNPQDMLDTEGNRYVDEDMLKSLEELEERGSRYLAGIFHAMQENNERSAKVTETTMHTMVALAKSVTDLKGVIESMQKSTTEDKGGDGEEGEVEKDTVLPALDAEDPISDLNPESGMKKSIPTGDFEDALRKSFYNGSHGNHAQEAKYHKYMDLAKMFPPEMVLSQMESDSDRDLVQAELLSA